MLDESCGVAGFARCSSLEDIKRARYVVKGMGVLTLLYAGMIAAEMRSRSIIKAYGSGNLLTSNGHVNSGLRVGHFHSRQSALCVLQRRLQHRFLHSVSTLRIRMLSSLLSRCVYHAAWHGDLVVAMSICMTDLGR